MATNVGSLVGRARPRGAGPAAGAEALLRCHMSAKLSFDDPLGPPGRSRRSPDALQFIPMRRLDGNSPPSQGGGHSQGIASGCVARGRVTEMLADVAVAPTLSASADGSV